MSTIHSLYKFFLTTVIATSVTVVTMYEVAFADSSESSSIEDLLVPTDGAKAVTDSLSDFSTDQGYKRWSYLASQPEQFVGMSPHSNSWQTSNGSILSSTGGLLKAGDSSHLVRRWVSHLTGEIILTNFLGSETYADIEQRIVLNRDGEESQTILFTSGVDGTGEVGTRKNINVQAGDSIDIIISAPDSDQDLEFSSWSRIESKSEGGLSFIISEEGIIELPVDCENFLIKENFTGTTTAGNGSLSVPNPGFFGTVLPNVNSYPQGTQLDFDAWTRCGQKLAEGSGLPTTDNDPTGTDQWYRLAGTPTAEWMSGSIVNNTPALSEIYDYEIQHIGLELSETILESYTAYTGSQYWDPKKDTFINIPNHGDAVIADHTPGSFEHRSPSPTESPVNFNQDVKNTVVSQKDAEEMAEFIQIQLLGKPYFDNKPCPVSDDPTIEEVITFLDTCLITPAEEKGYDGDRYTAAGLIERSAEHTGAGFSVDIGFIPNLREISDESNILGDYNAEYLKLKELIDPNGNATKLSPAKRVSLITPWLLFGYASGEIIPSEEWIQGILESVEGFVLIDPDNDTLGYLSSSLDLSGLGDLPEFSLFSSLPRDVTFQNIDGATLNKTDYVGRSTKGQPAYGPGCPEPDPVESVFQFHVPNRKSGGHSLWIFGKNRNSKVIVGSETGAKLIYPGCNDPVVVDPTDVPEPSLVVGLLSSLVGLGFLKARRSKV
jgi:hypothetical protein